MGRVVPDVGRKVGVALARFVVTVGLIASLSIAACRDDPSPCEVGASQSCQCSVGGMVLDGVQACTSGEWGACDCDGLSDGGAADATPGADAGPVCVCDDGEIETRPTLNCGAESRSCTDCEWSEWTESEPGVASPECTLGDVDLTERPIECDGDDEGLVRLRDCEACTWAEEPSECGGGCPGIRRAEPLDASEVCIPHRTFVRGCEEEGSDCYPRHEVEVSAFWVDRFAVTVRRYQECVDAGGCTPLMPIAVGDNPGVPDNYTFDDLSHGEPSIPVWTATHEQARSFCAWDGAELITGAQWELAALGSLETALVPYRDGGRDEELTYWESVQSTEVCFNGLVCGFEVDPLPPRDPVPFDLALVRNRQPGDIGVENLFWFYEWTADTLAPYEPAAPPPLDPVTPGSGPFERRGATSFAVAGRYDIAAREATDGDTKFNIPGGAAIRCARRAVPGEARER